MIDTYEPSQTDVTPELALQALAKAKPVNSAKEYAEIIRDNEHVARHYTQKDAERMSGLDCRAMHPVSVRPDCSFLACQIGRCWAKPTETLFELVAYGATWNDALHMLGRRVHA